jgi:hypothetical protein
MPTLRSSSLCALFALALPACTFPKDLGDSPLETASGSSSGSGSSSETGTSAPGTDGTSSSTDTSSTGPGPDEPTTSSTTATTSSTTATTGPDTGSSTGGPDEPDGMCFDENHGDYWCECTESQTEACGDDGVRVCMLKDDQVITQHTWGPCGECVPPGPDKISQGWQDCDANGEPGRQFCNVLDYWVDDIDDLPTPQWGTCLVEMDIVCEPGESKKCPDDISSQKCDVNEQGVPFWTDCP